jgi:uncharacterized coiled-coil DUF342 family protein
MDKTRVDDMLIEMITPKVKEIEEKFSQGKGLTQEDINTLLLKSQYNHINHLDSKLNEVTASVVALENKFDGKFSELEKRFTNKFSEFEKRFISLENKFELLNVKIEHTIQKALNKNMVMLIGMMGFFLTLSKALDIFIK